MRRSSDAIRGAEEKSLYASSASIGRIFDSMNEISSFVIRGRRNKETELALAKLLRKGGIIGWRRNQRVFGKPDFVFRKARLVVFVDGCFWHACPKHSNMPVNNRAFWKRKTAANQFRDRQVNRMLRRGGWRVIRIWEHDLSKRGAVCIGRIQAAVKSVV